MGTFPGLKNTERDELKKIYDEIAQDTKTPTALALRKQIWEGPKKLAKIRYWFKLLPGVQLLPNELEIFKKKYASWELVKEVIKMQRNLTSDDVKELYESLSPSEQISITVTTINNNKIDDTYRMTLIEKLIKQNNFHYHIELLRLLDQELSSFEARDVWKDALRKVIDEINSNTFAGKNFLDNWTSEMSIAHYVVDELGLSSLPLYELTGNESFLPKEAKDIFLF